MTGTGWGCPNTPPCPHPNLAHDIAELADPQPTCCAEGCDCRPTPAAEPAAAADTVDAPGTPAARAGERLVGWVSVALIDHAGLLDVDGPATVRITGHTGGVAHQLADITFDRHDIGAGLAFGLRAVASGLDISEPGWPLPGDVARPGQVAVTVDEFDPDHTEDTPPDDGAGWEATVRIGGLAARLDVDALWELADAATAAAGQVDETRPPTLVRCQRCARPLARMIGRALDPTFPSGGMRYEGGRGPFCPDGDSSGCDWRFMHGRGR